MSDDPHKTPFFSPRRVAIIAGGTFTQLVRMKVFYFLLIFGLFAIGIHFFGELPYEGGPETFGSERLRGMKSFLVFVIKLFAIILAVVATALLIPRDLEDRTLYTILAKPVPRLDYLLGKLLGILALIFIAMAVMTLLLDAVVYYRSQALLGEIMAMADRAIALGEWTATDKEFVRQDILAHGVTWSLQGAIVTIFYEAAIIASLALLVSTFSSSTLFTVIISTLCYFIGWFIANGRDYWLQEADLGDDKVVEIGSKLLIVVFPNFRPFGVSDKVIAGEVYPLDVFGSLTLTTAIYVAIYVVLSWFVFSDKEI